MKKIIVASLFVVIALAGCNLVNKEGVVKEEKKNVLSMDQAKEKALDFINNNLVQQGMTVEFKNIIEEDGFYKLVVDMGERKDIESYITKDGKKFIPTAIIDIEEFTEQNRQAREQSQAAAASQQQEVAKNDKPIVELFVMSHCPYGTQIEKGILPVLEKLGNKIDFELKFCDYAMHDKKEIDEQTRQYCIQKEQPDKLINYLNCFLSAGDSEGCIIKAGILESELDSCIETTDEKYKITESYNNRDSWESRFPPFDIYKGDNAKYSIKGSPGLVVNGKKVSSSRDADSLLNIICSGFNNPPEECGSELSTTVPSPGFGFGGSGSASSGSCN